MLWIGGGAAQDREVKLKTNPDNDLDIVVVPPSYLRL
jgi:hypothetical protein